MFNINNVKKYLPLGTVCLLKKAKKKVMIIGFAAKGQAFRDKVFDYIGCIYPEGILNSQFNLLFNHTDIQDVYFIGYSNGEEKAFKRNLNAFINENTKTGNNNLQVNNNQNNNIISGNVNNQINNSHINNNETDQN